MDDLTRNFPGCNFPTEELRDRIKKILGIEDAYFCYKCFKLLGINTIPKDAGLCNVCYQFYCKECSRSMYIDSVKQQVDPNRCPQCVDTRRFYA